MKRLIKLLSIFGVLIILGSCSSSKSVNVSTVAGITQYVKFTSLYSDDYPIKYVKITGGDYSGDIFFPDKEIKINNTTSYTIVWTYRNNVSTSSDYGKYLDVTKSEATFNSNYATLTVALGNTSSLFIYQQ